MNHKEYLKEAPKTLDPTLTPREQLVSCLLVVAGELEELRISIFSETSGDARGSIINECGDVLWYLACLETIEGGISRASYVQYTRGPVSPDLNACESIKKFAFHDCDRAEVMQMLGGAVYEVTMALMMVGASFEECRARNIAKLRARYPQGFVSGGGER